MFIKRKAQSVLEYVLVLTAVVTCIIWAASTFIKTSVDDGLTNAGEAIGNVAKKISVIND